MNVVNTSAPLKERRVKLRSEEWFDREIADQIVIRESLFRKFKKSQLTDDKQIFKAAKYEVIDLIKTKNIIFLRQN